MSVESATTAAVGAVIAYYGQTQPTSLRDTRIAVRTAMSLGVTPAQIAAGARVRPLLVLQFVPDEVHLDTLAVVRRDAERYLAEVMDVVRHTAVCEVHSGTEKRALCAQLGMSRPTLDAWLATAGTYSLRVLDAEHR